MSDVFKPSVSYWNFPNEHLIQSVVPDQHEPPLHVLRKAGSQAPPPPNSELAAGGPAICLGEGFFNF